MKHAPQTTRFMRIPVMVTVPYVALTIDQQCACAMAELLALQFRDPLSSPPKPRQPKPGKTKHLNVIPIARRGAKPVRRKTSNPESRITEFKQSINHPTKEQSL